MPLVKALDAAAPHNLLAALFQPKQQQVPTVVQVPSTVPSSRRAVTGQAISDTENRMTTSWGMGQLVGNRHSQVFMGPKNREGMKVFNGLDGISANAQEESEVIYQGQTREQVRDVLGVGSARGTVKKGRKTTMF